MKNELEKQQIKPQVAMTNKGFAPTDIDQAYRMATWMSESDMVPDRYQGEPGKCMIAYDYSLRLGVSYLTVMQHVYNVHGRPAMEAVLAIALTNKSGLFVDPLEYEIQGKRAKDKDYAVRAFAKRKTTGTVLYGPWIDWSLVSGEGWDKKKGSKWLTMPEQMFHYRAASWFQRRHCPEVTMGMMTTEEAQEVPPRKHIDSITFDEAQKEAAEEAEAKTGSVPVNAEIGDPDPTEPAEPETENNESFMEDAPDTKANAEKQKADLAAAEVADAGEGKLVCQSCGATFDKKMEIKKGGRKWRGCPECNSKGVIDNPQYVDENAFDKATEPE